MKNLFANLWMKLLAVVLSFGVWLTVSAPRRERVIERAFAAPLALVGMPRDLIITTPVPDTVSVRLRGRVTDLRSLSSQNLEVTVDLSWAQPGEAQITVRPQALNIPADIEVVSIDPAKVRFRVEQLRQRAVRIRPFLVGQPPLGYLAGDPTVTPDQALISGPVSQIRGMTEVATERIIMTGRTEPFVQTVAVVADSPLVRIVEPQTAQVSVPVTAEMGPPLAPTTTDTTGTGATTTATTSTSGTAAGQEGNRKRP
jgi:YbbR domain-containing protein